MRIKDISVEDRRSIILNTAQHLKVAPAIIEKDLWVTLVLDYLFHQCPYAASFVFKGGTSLAKAYGLISRFSEDVDLILDWRVLGLATMEPWEERSKSRQDKFNKEVNQRAAQFIGGILCEQISKDLSEQWGRETYVKPDPIDGLTLLVHYPRMYDQHGLLQVIRLEIGPLAAWTPSISASIKAFSEEKYSGLIDGAKTTVKTVSAERTFWEKATILHHEANRPAVSAMPDRYSRHYYDLYRMLKSPVHQAALEQMDLLKQVVRFKMKFYPRGWAKYEDVLSGKLLLMPPDIRKEGLQDDYQKMQVMLMGEAPVFEDVLAEIGQFEKEASRYLNRFM